VADEIKLPTGPIGIYLSGGSDSAILFWLLASQRQHDVVLLTVASDDKKYNIEPALAVSRWIQCYTSVPILEHCVTIAPNLELRKEYRDQATNNLTEQYNLSCWVSGKTRNPDVKLKYHEQRKKDRDVLLTRVIHNHFYRPFYDVNKSHLAMIYKKYNLKALQDLTVSCETSYPPCEDCWWCAEREWAFSTTRTMSALGTQVSITAGNTVLLSSSLGGNYV